MVNPLKNLIVFALLCIGHLAFSESENYMTVWRYYGQRNFKEAYVMGLTQRGTAFESDRIGHLQSVSYSEKLECKSLLTYNQNYSLSLMVPDGYLDWEGFAYQQSVEHSVVPEQIVFTDTGTILSRDEFNVFTLPSHQRGKALKSIRGVADHSLVEYKKSGMWLVSGQTFNAFWHEDPSADLLRQHPLPWQSDPELKVPSDLMDRKKYPYIWEFGRAGQLDPRSAEKNVRAQVLLAWQERRYLKPWMGDSDGLITVHSLGETRTKVFSRIYKAQIFPENWKNLDNTILVMPLTEAIKRFPPEKISFRVAKIMELSEGALTNLQALDLLTHNLNYFRTDLDFESQGKPNTEAVTLEDMTLKGYRMLMLATLEQYSELTQLQRMRIYRYLLKNLYTEKPDSEIYPDYAYMSDAWAKLAYLNSLQISNVNPHRVQESQDYLPQLIRSTVEYYTQRLQKNGAVKKDIEAHLKDINICVRTESELVEEALQKLGGTLQGSNKDHQYKYTKIYCFEWAQLRSLPQRDDAKITEGYWHTRRLLAHPLQF